MDAVPEYVKSIAVPRGNCTGATEVRTGWRNTAKGTGLGASDHGTGPLCSESGTTVKTCAGKLKPSVSAVALLKLKNPLASRGKPHGVMRV